MPSTSDEVFVASAGGAHEGNGWLRQRRNLQESARGVRAAALGRGGLEIFDNELNDPGDCVRDPVQRQAASLGDSVLRSGPERFRVRPGDTGVHAGGLWLTLRSLASEGV